MKFRLKITICMLWILALAFGVGGSLLITLSFKENFQHEMQTALSSFKMVLNTINVVDESGSQPDHSNLTEALIQLDMQGGGNWSAIRLGEKESVLYEDNQIGAQLCQELKSGGNMAEISVLKLEDGGRHIRISTELASETEKLRLDVCYDISPIYAQREEQLLIYRRVFLVVVTLSAALCWALAYWLTLPLSSLSKA